MHDQINQASLQSSESHYYLPFVEPLRHKRARTKARLPLEVKVLEVTGEARDLDVAPYSKDYPLAARKIYPLPTLRQIYETAIEVNPHEWLPPSIAAKSYRSSESTIARWIRNGALKSVILCDLHGFRRMRRIYRPDLDRLLVELASRAPSSKWAAVAAAAPSIIELRRAKRRRARQAARLATLEKMYSEGYPRPSLEMIADFVS